MAWPKGKTRPENSGRKKGTVNKNTQTLQEICAKHNIDVFEAMVMLCIEEGNKDKRFERLKEIAKYIYPQRKAVEHSGELDSKIEVIISDYRSKKNED